MTSNRRGPTATGTIDWRRGPGAREPHWHVRLSLANGKRSPWIALDPNIKEHDREGAKACAKLLSDEARAEGLVHGDAETVGSWFKRFHEHKEARGLSSVADMRGRASKWIFPGLEFKAMREVTREDLEAIVRRLDKAILAWQEADGERGEGKLSTSTAANVWGDLVHAFDEAVRSKDTSLRVLEVSPAALVRGPETGIDREGPILYSDEIELLLRGKAVEPGAADVPLYRRRVYAGSIYTMTRRSELAAVTAVDVDRKHGTISISKQVEKKKKDPNATSKGTKKTKTGRSRSIDIEPALLPLIDLLLEAPEGRDGRLFRVPPPEDCAELLRKDLRTVGVRREALHSEDSTRTPIVFHSLRDTGLTHMAVRGDSPIVVQWRGGHTDFKTTQGYIDRGRVEARRIGEPLPPLPPEVLGPSPTGGTSGPNNELVAVDDGTVETPSENLSPNLSRDRLEEVNMSDISSLSATPTGIEAALNRSNVDHLNGIRDRPDARPRSLASEPRALAAPVTDTELERAIVNAVLMGLGDVARTLASQLDERHRLRGNNVVSIDTCKRRSPS
jgi:integrase